MSAEKISSQIKEIENLKKEIEGSSSPKFNSWRSATERCLKNIFGPNSDQLRFQKYLFYTSISYYGWR